MSSDSACHGNNDKKAPQKGTDELKFCTMIEIIPLVSTSAPLTVAVDPTNAPGRPSAPPPQLKKMAGV